MKAATLLIVSLFSAVYVSGQRVPVEVSGKSIKELVERWNAAHADGRASAFVNLYVNPTKFYGKWYTPRQCAEAKEAYLKKHKDFKQRIVSTALNLSAFPHKEIIKCEFVKEVTTEAGVKQVAATLYITEIPGEYRIFGESDEIADRELRITYDLGTQYPLVDTDDPKSRQAYEEKKDSAAGYSWATVAINLLFLGLVVYGVRKIILWRRRQKKQEASRYDYHAAGPPPNYNPETGFYETRRKAPKANPSWSDVIEAEDVEIIVEKPRREMPRREEPQREKHLSEKEKGDLFENYVVKKFDERFFELKEWRSDKYVDGRYAKSNLDPDMVFMFVLRDVRKRFAVECKYRASLHDGKFTIDDAQLHRYRQYAVNRRIDVYMVLGLGGTPDAPQELFLVPLDQLASLEYGFLLKYRRRVEFEFFMDSQSQILR